MLTYVRKRFPRLQGLWEDEARHIPTIKHRWVAPWHNTMDTRLGGQRTCFLLHWAFARVASIPETSPFLFYLDYSSFSFTTRLKCQLFQETFLGPSLLAMLP